MTKHHPTLRVIGLGFGLAVLALVFVASLTIASHDADADCHTSTLCTIRYGRQSCTETTYCSQPRIPVCHFVTRCYPQRTCHSSYGTTTCVTRDLCHSERVCW